MEEGMEPVFEILVKVPFRIPALFSLGETLRNFTSSHHFLPLSIILLKLLLSHWIPKPLLPIPFDTSGTDKRILNNEVLDPKFCPFLTLLSWALIEYWILTWLNKGDLNVFERTRHHLDFLSFSLPRQSFPIFNYYSSRLTEFGYSDNLSDPISRNPCEKSFHTHPRHEHPTFK